MGASRLKRLTLVLTAVAFVLATALPNSLAAARMAGGGAMVGSVEEPCSNCPGKTPAGNDIAPMACGALACTGVAIGLPTHAVPSLPAGGALGYPPRPVVETVGLSPAPDPFPPRATVLL